MELKESCRFGSLMRREEKRRSVFFPHPSATKMTAVFRASLVRNKNDGCFSSLTRPQQKRRPFSEPHSSAAKTTLVFRPSLSGKKNDGRFFSRRLAAAVPLKKTKKKVFVK
ncbi:hypothetical protein [Reichenbachiella versicolor]|uniref:hypothetical protein n=1 Tax=Reichenbachiella versicolor TaxID=1821036 RepID=UPI0013A53602|nr:hypothetical protein [Reichenbachiella versicolor]